MDRGKRPVGRQKRVKPGSSQVHKRGEGLHMGGPVGNPEGFSTGSRKSSSTPKFRRRRSTVNPELGQMLGNIAMEEMTSGRKKSPLTKLILLAVIIMLGGGGSLGALLGGDSTGMDTSHSLLNSYSGYEDSWGDYNSWESMSGNQQAGTSGISNSGFLNTEVSPKARDKRTVIRGNGRDVITIMVYMCGTDLESRSRMATSDLQEMLAADLSDNINLLVYTGGCKNWQNNVVSSSVNQIYKIENGGLVCLADNVGSKSMTDPNTLSQYIRWAKDNFPADRYDLIMWDHGGGSISGYGYDELHRNSGSMTLDKIGKALEDGGCTFDFIGFDACLMATLETAMVVEPYADYLIASEETEPGIGWYYTDWLTSLSENSSMSTLEIGQNIVDDFVAMCGKKTRGAETTLSLIDLAELKGTVPEKFKAFAKSTASQIKKDKYHQVSNARSQTKEFARSTGIDQVDLIHLADNLETDESQALAKALRDAVKYNRTSNNVHNAYGISIYFPYGSTSSVNQMANTYNKIGLDSAYTDCIKSFASLEAGGQMIAGGTSGQLGSLFGSLLGGGSGYSPDSMESDMAAELLESLLSGRSLGNIGLDKNSAGFLDKEILEANEKYLTENQFNAEALVWETKDGEQVLKLKEDQWDLIQAVELNVFVDDGEGFIDLGLDNVYRFNEDGDLVGDYDRTWIALDGQIVAYYMLSAEGDEDSYHITGRVPAMLNDDRVDLILAFSSENPDGEVLGARPVYENGETDTVAKGLIELEYGDTLDFLCDYYDYDQNYMDSYYLGESMIIRENPEVSNISMENTDYTAAYRLTDIYNNHYWTPAVK